MSVQKRTERLDWDGLRYFRAVAMHGTLANAARELGVQHTTVARRIDALEEELGARLFLRNARGYTPTRTGASLLDAAEAMRAQMDRAARLARGQNVEMAGAVRIATADTLATHLVLPAIPKLLRANPRLCVEIVSDTRQHDLARREADLALRIGTPSDSRLIGRRLGPLGFGVYGARNAKKGDLQRAPFVAFDESVGVLPHDEWLASHAPHARIAVRANRQQTLIDAVKLGVGLAILPCIAAEEDRALKRLLAPRDVLTRDLWLIVHPDLQNASRVRALMDAISTFVGENARRVRGPEAA